MALQFRKEDGVGKTVYEWWQSLDNHRDERAGLRRAATLTDIPLLPAYHRLYARVDGDRRWSAHQRDGFAAAVALLSHLRAESDQSLPLAMSDRPQGVDRNPVSELRFRRLLEASDLDTLFAGLRRALPLIGHKTAPLQLVNDVFYWGDEVKKRWAYAYRWPESNR